MTVGELTRFLVAPVIGSIALPLLFAPLSGAALNTPLR
jgi:hypothetical protein